MKKTVLRVLPVAAVFFAGGLMISSGLFAQEGGQKKYGVIHNIAEDRQVERVGGIYEPEGLDKYMKRRFDDIVTRLEALDSRLGAIEAELVSLREMMEQEQKESTLVS